MENKKFDQAKYMRDWQKENMKQVKASYKAELCRKNLRKLVKSSRQSNLMSSEKQCEKTIDQANK